MKKSFFLYFLVLSPLIFSQNSLQYDVDGYKSTGVISNENNFVSISNKIIRILNKNSSINHTSSPLIEPHHIALDDNEFSSLLLIKQLEELNFKTPFNVVHNPTLERFIRVYLKNRRDDLSNLMGKAQYYFPMFEEYLDKYDLPLEIKYLAIVESALIPNANSPSGAKGIWQFMLGTGKQYGLDVNSYVDERYSPIKSTEAACKYLSSLYRTFKDWDLALAAYNSGPGNVNKAIKRGGGNRNYWEIRQYLPQETRSYVPAFYATYYIFEYADIHQLKPNYTDLTYLEVDTIHIKKPLSFKSIEKTITINYDLLIALNPQYKKEFIPFSKSKEYALTLPKDLIHKFIENERLFYETTKQNNNNEDKSNSIKITEFNSYEVKNGDNLNRIAIKHHISLQQLKKWNGLQTNYLIAGQRLVITDKTYDTIKQNNLSHYNNKSIKIPFSPEISSNFSPNIFQKKDPRIINNFETYIVKEGDTLFNISRRYSKVSVDQLRNWNDINNVKFLKPGTKLKIFKS